ncbi:MAG: hypothetical protein ABI605_18085 [Rhizobacter sp.]
MAQQMVRLADVAWQTQVAEEAAEAVQQSEERLCFGYFHLARQMKVTRPPGRNPAPKNKSGRSHNAQRQQKDLLKIIQPFWIPAFAGMTGRHWAESGLP